MSRNALVVGINTYQYLSNLVAPAADAEAIARRLEEDGDFRVTRLPEAIVSTPNANIPTVGSTRGITQAQLENALIDLFQPSSNQFPDTALFYFSGHGVPDVRGYDQGFLATSDTDPQYPRLSVSLRWLQWLLAESPVRQQVVWLDCCHSGALLINVESANPGYGNSRDRCFIASSRSFERSWQDLNSPYSVLTKALLEGLDPQRLRGRWVDTFSLIDYVNQALKGELQTPICTNFGEAINLTRCWQDQSFSVESLQIDSNICPYKGLEFFDLNNNDFQYFFGRERLTDQLLDRVRTNNFIALVGASGSGKSSVLRAGLLHQIQLGQRITGSNQWRIRITCPDRNPMQNLALAFVDEVSDLDRAESLIRASNLLCTEALGLSHLVQASTASRVILVIDQFEEVFTLCENNEEREQFFACLMSALSSTNNQLCLIIAVRSDFIGKCLEQKYSGLAQTITSNTINVLPMEDNEIRDIICKPAHQAGLEVDAALVTEILADIKGSPGNLPLLQYALKTLWQQRQSNQLTLSIYHEMGGISGTLDKRATEIYQNFNAEHQSTMQHIFQQLTQLGEGTEDTRRRMLQSDLISVPQHTLELVSHVIATLTAPENRLLVASAAVGKNNCSEQMVVIDVAHESLIRHWQLLRQWIEKSRDLLRQKHQIEASAIAWREHNYHSDYLLKGKQCLEAKHIYNLGLQQRFSMPPVSVDFIRNSIQYRQIHRVKVMIFFALPLLLALITAEHFIREAKVNKSFENIRAANTKQARESINYLIRGCKERRNHAGWFPLYLDERLFGNCRSLTRVILAGIHLEKISLNSADLTSTDLRGGNLSGADLYKAYLMSSDLRGINLRASDLRYADLSGADLSGANLTQAKLNGAKLRGIRLYGADLSFADLSHVIALEKEGLEEALICKTILPNNLNISSDRDCSPD